jgi:hypothetical protein
MVRPAPATLGYASSRLVATMHGPHGPKAVARNAQCEKGSATLATRRRSALVALSTSTVETPGVDVGSTVIVRAARRGDSSPTRRRRRTSNRRLHDCSARCIRRHRRPPNSPSTIAPGASPEAAPLWPRQRPNRRLRECRNEQHQAPRANSDHWCRRPGRVRPSPAGSPSIRSLPWKGRPPSWTSWSPSSATARRPCPLTRR